MARLGADIARRVPTNGEEIRFDCDGTKLTDRKAVGERILGYTHEMRKRGTEARWTLGTFNGIGLEISGYGALNTDCRPYLCTVILIQHHVENREFEVTDSSEERRSRKGCGRQWRSRGGQSH